MVYGVWCMCERADTPGWTGLRHRAGNDSPLHQNTGLSHGAPQARCVPTRSDRHSRLSPGCLPVTHGGGSVALCGRTSVRGAIHMLHSAPRWNRWGLMGSQWQGPYRSDPCLRYQGESAADLYARIHLASTCCDVYSHCADAPHGCIALHWFAPFTVQVTLFSWCRPASSMRCRQEGGR